ncbi:MAG: phosphoribosylformylglycinamidine synthase I [Candidatus Omnitrophica bacterium]|nr:phosphoribosylformylglycinamidine synthase I [Candidatus Omnitrophota bacterium]
MSTPKVLVLRTAGTNCDKETAYAFELAGARAEMVHINRFIKKERDLSEYQILAIPGGFTYGDDVASGKILANEIKNKLGEDIKNFIDDGKLIIGICNGFQVLVKAGFLPDLNGFQTIQATLTINDSAKFEDRWVYLKLATCYSLLSTKCVWAQNIPETIYLPVAHGEGKFVPRDKEVLRRLRENNQIVFQYVDEKGNLAGYPYNPNGSVENIAGICDNTGRIFGLMPHPERHIFSHQHPRWTRKKCLPEGDGLAIFRNGVGYIKKNL